MHPMTRDNDNPWLDPLLSRRIHHEPAEFNFSQWLQAHPEEARLLERKFGDAGRNNEREKDPHPIWRCIMASKMTRYSAAAVIVLAATFVVLNPLGTSPCGVALAAVQEKVAQVNTMVLRGEKVFSTVAEPNLVLRFDVVKYFSRQYGHVEEGRMHGAVVYRMTLNLPEKQFLVLLPPWKKYVKRPCTEEQMQIMERLTPTRVMDLLVETESRRLGPAQIDGIAAEGFEFQDIKQVQNIVPKYLFDIQAGAGTVWVGTQELLPIRIEGDLLIGKSMMTLFTDMRLHEVAVLESYDVELQDSTFRLEIPEGYTEFQLTDVLATGLNLVNLVTSLQRAPSGEK
jgi:hypothetical protein